MSTLLAGLILFSFSAPMALFLHKKIEELIGFSILGIIVVLYISGLSGNLSLGFYAVIFLAIFSFLILIVMVRKNQKNGFRFLVTPGFLAFCIFLVVVWFGHNGRMFSEWDEFSHWGLVIKNMVALDKLGNAPEATTSFRGYPPAASLFCYFWIRLSGSFNESDAFRSSNIFLFSLILPVFKILDWKKIGRLLALILITLLLPPMFNETALTTIYVDTLLGLFFAYILFWYFSSKGSPQEFVLLFLALFTLPLVKASGTGLALIAAFIIALDILLIQKQWLAKKRVTYTAIAFLSVLAGKYSWDIYLKITDTKEAWDSSALTLPGVIALLRGQGEEYQNTTIRNFIKGLLFPSQYSFGNIIKLPIFLWAILFVILSLLLLHLLESKNLKKRYLLCLSGVSIGFCIYTLSLLLLYLFTFSEYESQRLASFSRYISTFLVGMFAFLIYLFVTLLPCKKFFKINICYYVLCFMLCFVSISTVLPITFSAESSIAASVEIRDERSIPQEVLDKLNPSTDHVYIISQRDNGFSNVIHSYSFTPVNAGTSAWSLGKPYYDGDIWTKDLSVEELSQRLLSYTHLYIYKADEQFINLYGILFDSPQSIQDKTLYRIVKSGDTVKLIKA